MTKLTFIFEDQTFVTTDEDAIKKGYGSGMEQANYHFSLPQGAWFGHYDTETIPENTWKWVEGNFWD